LRYQWQRNGVNIPGATASQYTLFSATASDDGATFGVQVTNPYGSVMSSAATKTAAPIALWQLMLRPSLAFPPAWENLEQDTPFLA
jgi:hypothetical protein